MFILMYNFPFFLCIGGNGGVAMAVNGIRQWWCYMSFSFCMAE